MNKKLIGQTLLEANLVSAAQIKVALNDKVMQDYLDLPRHKLGEILSLRGWVKQQTVDFFVEQWPQVLIQPKRQKIGFYLQKAALLDSSQIDWILRRQSQQLARKKFGEIAQQQGWLNPETLNFFLKHLYLENSLKNTNNQHKSIIHNNSLKYLNVGDALTKYMMGNTNLTQSALDKVQFSNIVLEYADLTGSLIREADLEESILDFANLTKTNLSNSNLVRVSAIAANFSYAILQKCNLLQASLIEANLQGTNLQGANLQGANLHNAKLDYALLQGANLKAANLEGVSFRKAYYDRTTLLDREIDPQKLGMQFSETSFSSSEKLIIADKEKNHLANSRATIILEI